MNKLFVDSAVLMFSSLSFFPCYFRSFQRIGGGDFKTVNCTESITYIIACSVIFALVRNGTLLRGAVLHFIKLLTTLLVSLFEVGVFVFFTLLNEVLV